MSQVVYASIDYFDEMKSARWVHGVNESYAATQRMANRFGGIRLVGRQDKLGSVQITFAAGKHGGWRQVNGFHMTLAKYFADKLEHRAPGDVLNVFFDGIDNEDALFALRQIVGVTVGAQAGEEEIKSALRMINADLIALGMPAGDWTFVPMLNSLMQNTTLPETISGRA